MDTDEIGFPMKGKLCPEKLWEAAGILRLRKVRVRMCIQYIGSSLMTYQSAPRRSMSKPMSLMTVTWQLM